MIRSLCLAALGAAVCAPSFGAMYQQVFTQAQAAGSQADPFLDTVVTKDGVAYALVRDRTSAVGGSVVAYDGSTFTEIMDSADWLAAGATADIGGFLGAAVVNRGLGDKVRFVNFFDNSIWEVDTTTGTPVRVVSEATINAFTVGSVNLTASNAMLSDGTAIAYDGTSDSVLQITPGGFVFNQISDAELTSLTGSDILAGTGFALVGADLYFGSNSGDSLYKWNVITDTGSVVFDTAALEALSDDIDGSAGIDDVYFAPNRLVYFYEDDADYIYSFDPADPAGTLSVVLTEAELQAGPAMSDGVAQFSWWNGALAWTDQGTGFYALVPEPTAAVMLLLAAAPMLRRR